MRKDEAVVFAGDFNINLTSASDVTATLLGTPSGWETAQLATGGRKTADGAVHLSWGRDEELVLEDAFACLHLWGAEAGLWTSANPARVEWIDYLWHSAHLRPTALSVPPYDVFLPPWSDRNARRASARLGAALRAAQAYVFLTSILTFGY